MSGGKSVTPNGKDLGLGNPRGWNRAVVTKPHRPGDLNKTLICYSSRGWEVPDECAGQSVPGGDLLPDLKTSAFLLCPHISEGQKKF